MPIQARSFKKSAVLDAFALAIIATGGPAAFPGIPGDGPDLTIAREHARSIDKAMDELLKVTTKPGSYVSESDFSSVPGNNRSGDRITRGWQL